MANPYLANSGSFSVYVELESVVNFLLNPKMIKSKIICLGPNLVYRVLEI